MNSKLYSRFYQKLATIPENHELDYFNDNMELKLHSKINRKKKLRKQPIQFDFTTNPIDNIINSTDNCITKYFSKCFDRTK